ncbi:MAG: lysophospholipid acyltransferase family protein [Actinobacteria bacterium]|nr:lysophospholipid acyltransferase family protein [Actinomycetota bacterium]
MTKVDTNLAGQGRIGKLFYAVIRGILVALCRTYFRLSVKGRENIPKTGAFILAPIHRSNVDTPISCAATTRRLRYMGKDSLWKNKTIGSVLSALGGFPVTRGTADLEALKRCLAVLALGEPMVMFPEGTRQFGETIQPLFDGAAYLAIKANVPIVPVGIGGTQDVMPKGKKMIFPRKCTMIIGAPIYPPVPTTGRTPRTATTELTANLKSALQELFDAAQSAAH